MFIGLIVAYCQQHGTAQRAKWALALMPRARVAETSAASRRWAEFFAAGQSVAELQQMYGLTRGMHHQPSRSIRARQAARWTANVCGRLQPGAVTSPPSLRRVRLVWPSAGGPLPLRRWAGIYYHELHLLRLAWLGRGTGIRDWVIR